MDADEDMKSKYEQWWGNMRDKILRVSEAETSNDRVQAILQMAGQETTNGMYIPQEGYST